MRGDDEKAQVEIRFVEHEIIEYRVQRDIEHHISSATGRVLEGIKREELPEKGEVKPGDDLFYLFFHICSF